MKELYFDSSYLTSWSAVIEHTWEQDGQYYVVLSQTAFYPHGGGQPCDTGTIDGIPVLDVQRQDGQVLHQLPSLPEQPDGAEVYCEIDWQRRFDHMQQHTGQHLLSAVCLDMLSAPTLSFHLGEQESTIDVDTLDCSADQLVALEKKINEIIYRNIPVNSYFVDAEQLATLTLVKPPSVTDHVRIVEIEGIEHNACGGTHVSRTGELGMIKLYKAEKTKGHIRLYFKYGWRVWADYSESLHILDHIASRFNTGRRDIVGRFDKWEQEQRQQRDELQRLRSENDAFLLNTLLSSVDAQQEQPLLVHHFADKSLQDLQRLAAQLLDQRQCTVLLSSEQDYKIVLAQNGHPHVKSGAFFKQHLSTYGGKGGGNDTIAQAGFASSEALQEFCTFAKSELLKVEQG
ncbi:alanyl-tRNA editing protein [Paenibacillus kandeliae]|uniref:alanyl-tRNA editing protein n=1 Tax=Paenibacillus kandeliae TaxID=3231269 RepID=UPI00345B3C4F